MVLSTASDAETRGAVMDDANKAASAVEYVCAIDGCNNVATRVRQFNRDPNFVYRWCNETHAGATLKPRAMPLPVVLTRAPEAVNVSRLMPTVISPSCNCDELIAARETIARLTVEIDKREAARAEADKIACKVFAMDSSLRLELATVTQERDALRTSLDLAAQAVNNLAHGPRGSK